MHCGCYKNIHARDLHILDQIIIKVSKSMLQFLFKPFFYSIPLGTFGYLLKMRCFLSVLKLP